MTVWGVVTFGFDYTNHLILEALHFQEEDAKKDAAQPSSLVMDFPHRNMRGYVRLEADKPITLRWSDVRVTDEEKRKGIERMIGGDHV